MTDTTVAPEAKSSATVAPDQMTWDSRTRRLVTIYLPTYNQLQLAGRWLVEHYSRFCEPDSPDWDAAVAKRTQLITLLQLELSLSGSLTAGAAILAPLATALVGLLLPGA